MVGELAAVVGGGELLEFVVGLAAEVAAVDEEEDALGTGELDEAVGLGDGGEGLAGAGGHLDEGARALAARDFSRPVTASIWHSRSGAVFSAGNWRRRARRVSGCWTSSSRCSGVWKAKTERERERGRAGRGSGFDAGGLVGEGQGIGPALGNPFLAAV